MTVGLVLERIMEGAAQGHAFSTKHGELVRLQKSKFRNQRRNTSTTEQTPLNPVTDVEFNWGKTMMYEQAVPFGVPTCQYL